MEFLFETRDKAVSFKDALNKQSIAFTAWPEPRDNGSILYFVAPDPYHTDTCVRIGLAVEIGRG